MSYAYDTIADIIRLAEENNISFGDVVLRYELENYDRSEEARKRPLVCPVVRRHSLMVKLLDL